MSLLKLWGRQSARNAIGKVSILIPTRFDSRYIVELCIKSIRKNTDYTDYEIIVCDSGVDEPTRKYLSELESRKEIRLITATDKLRPKDDLVGAVNGEYYIIMHDDVQIKRKNWLSRRVNLLNKNPKNAIVGSIVKNFNKSKRFFPLGLLVKMDVSKKLNLKWGKQPELNLDTGAVAYDKFFSQNEFKFVPCKFSRDIRHFGAMAWPMRKIMEETSPLITKKVLERKDKIALIRKILEKGKY